MPARIRNIRDIRLQFQLSAAEFGAALGYRHENRHHLRQQVYDMETGRKPVSPAIGRLAEMFARFGIPKDYLEQPTKETSK